jgi:hypothetical protein
MRIEGGAFHYIYRSASPRYQPSWVEFKKDLALVMLGCSVWERFFDRFARAVESTRPTSTVSAAAYNPADLVVALARAFGASDYRFVPQFRIVESSSEGARVYVGALVWSGKPVKVTPEGLLRRLSGGLHNYLLARNFGEAHKKYDEACEALGLRSVVFEISNPGSPKAIIGQVAGSTEPGIELSGPLPPSIRDFVECNAAFGTRLVEHVRSMMAGLV